MTWKAIDMAEETCIVYDYARLESVANVLQGLMGRVSIFTFIGSLGAGKTSLIRTILQQCGVKEIIASPTFTYMNMYVNEHGQIFYHFDLYRIQDIDSFIQAGFDEYLHVPHSFVFIEWPEVVMPLLKDDVCHARIEYYEHNQRMICYKIG